MPEDRRFMPEDMPEDRRFTLARLERSRPRGSVFLFRAPAARCPNAEDRRFMPKDVPEDMPEDRRFTLGSNDPGPRTGVSRSARTIQAALARGWPEDRRFTLGSNDPGRADLSFFRAPAARCPNAGDRRFMPEDVPEDARGQAFHARLKRSRPRADLSFARSPLAGRPRLLGTAAHSGLYRDRTAEGE
jgi:hypothetical protein